MPRQKRPAEPPPDPNDRFLLIMDRFQLLTEKIDGHGLLLEEMRAQNRATIEFAHETRESLERRMDEGFQRTDGRIDVLEIAVREHSGRLQQVERTVGALDHRLENVEVKVGALDHRLQNVEIKVGELDHHLQNVEVKIDAVDAKIDRLDGKLDARVTALERRH